MTNLEIFGIIKARVPQKPQGDLSGVIDGSIQTLEIPSVSSIRGYAFCNCTNLTSIMIPDSVTSIGDFAFHGCTSLKRVTIPNSVTGIGNHAFYDCRNLMSVTLPNNVTRIEREVFSGCTSLTSVTLPNNVTSIEGAAFSVCNNLENVTLENGFNCNGLNLSASTKFSVDTMIAMFNALADRTGLSAYTLTLGNTNLAKLSNEQIAIATEKNWTLA